MVPELPGCSAFGGTEEAAVEEVKNAIELWLETAKKKVVGYHNLKEKNYLTHFMKYFKAVNITYNYSEVQSCE